MADKTTALRCAVYTRKSSEEGLEQDFNSLDAQREACEAFIASQRLEGWIALAQAYNDGGVSGGTMERPALQRLLADIAAGNVNVVVVYKVDRLTRALSDFAWALTPGIRSSSSIRTKPRSSVISTSATPRPGTPASSRRNLMPRTS